MHEEIVRERDGDTLILFIHGIMGSPSQFAAWMDAVYGAGYSVASLLLPGHGADGRAFAQNRLPEWESYVSAALGRYQDRYENIVAVGHSMGGLLALNESLHPERHIVGLFMLSPPIQINLRPWSIKTRLQLVLTDKQREIWREYQKVYSISGTPIYIYPAWVRQLWSLKRLIEKTKRNLAKVSVPVYIVHSLKDETVSIKSSDALDAGLAHVEHERFKVYESWHAYYTAKDTQIITDKLLAFIERVVRGNESRP